MTHRIFIEKVGFMAMAVAFVTLMGFHFSAGQAQAVIKKFCVKSIGAVNCADPFQIVTVADTSDDTNGGCPTGKTYQGCIENFTNHQVCCGPDTGGKIPCGTNCKTVCSLGQTKTSSGWCPSGQVCCTGEASTECTNESAVKCFVGANKPSADGLYSYTCVPIGTCKGTDLGQANCSQGLSGAACCQIPKCQGVKGTSSSSTTTAKSKPVAPVAKVYNLYNPIGTTSIPELIGRFINVFLGIVGAIALLVFVYGGIMWMTARGNTKQADSARGALVNAAIGLFIIAFAYTLSSNFITMLTTVQVPPPERLPSEQQTVAETEQAAEQQSVQQQKAEEQQAKKQTQEKPITVCAPGRMCMDMTCSDKSIYSECWAAGCSGIQVCCPPTVSCPSP